MKNFFIIGLFIFPLLTLAEVSPGEIITLKAKKDKIIRDTEYRQKLMALAFSSNQRIKSLVKKFASNQQGVHDQENLSRIQAKKIHKLSKVLAQMRTILSKRMKTIYKLNELGHLRILLNNFQAGNFDKNMIYFKKFISKDMDRIAKYNTLMNTYNRENKILNNKIKKLLSNRKNLKKSEEVLEKAQKTRVKILTKLRKQINNDENILASEVNKKKHELLSSLYRISFFEKKGHLKPPVNAKVFKSYGLYNDNKFNIQFINKGITYSSKEEKPVSAVFSGTIEFAGTIPGHGKTVIINHKDEYYSVYSLLNSLYHKKGDKVDQGQYLGNNLKISNKNYQMYFEIRHFSEHLNPQHWIQTNFLAKN